MAVWIQISIAKHSCAFIEDLDVRSLAYIHRCEKHLSVGSDDDPNTLYSQPQVLCGTDTFVINI